MVYNLLKNYFYFTLCVWVFTLHAFMFTVCSPGTHRGKKKASYSLELELYRQLWSFIWVLGLGPLEKEPVFLTTEPYLQPQQIIFKCWQGNKFSSKTQSLKLFIIVVIKQKTWLKQFFRLSLYKCRHPNIQSIAMQFICILHQKSFVPSHLFQQSNY